MLRRCTPGSHISVALITHAPISAALDDVGIRGRFSYGTYQGGPPQNATMDIADLERLHDQWHDYANEGLLTLGMASRGVNPSGIAANHPVLLESRTKIGQRRVALKFHLRFIPAEKETSNC